MVAPVQIKELIEKGLRCERVEVHGDDGAHFEALIVSEEFAGKSKVAQHQLVYKALGDRMRNEIHALSMRTLTPEQWAQQRNPG
jgi:acid stress-induced BolA-like protein IbaG/YrbA